MSRTPGQTALLDQAEAAMGDLLDDLIAQWPHIAAYLGATEARLVLAAQMMERCPEEVALLSAQAIARLSERGRS